MTRRGLTILAAALLAVAWSPTARADTASDIAAELSESGLPGLSVTVATPPAATAADVAAFNADPAVTPASLSPASMLSPNPTAPLPVATVRFGKASVTPLPGLIYAPGVAGYDAVEDADMPVWRIAIMSALRHRIASGVQLAGVAMQPQFPNRPGSSEPDLWVAAPIPSQVPAAPAPKTRTAGDVRTSVMLSLPVYAKSADVSVVDRARAGRVVTVRLPMVPASAASGQLAELAAHVRAIHTTLNGTGAGISMTILRVVDALDGKPLFTAAADPDWGQFSAWSAPTVRAFAEAPTLRPQDAEASGSALVEQVTGVPAP